MFHSIFFIGNALLHPTGHKKQYGEDICPTGWYPVLKMPQAWSHSWPVKMAQMELVALARLDEATKRIVFHFAENSWCPSLPEVV